MKAYHTGQKRREVPEMVRLQLQDQSFVWVKRFAMVLFILSCVSLVLDRGLQTEILLLIGHKSATAHLLPIEEQLEHGAGHHEHVYAFTLRGNKTYYGMFMATSHSLTIDTPFEIWYSPLFPSRNKKRGTKLLDFIALIIIGTIAAGLWYSAKHDFFMNRSGKQKIAEYGLFAPGLIQARIRDKKSKIKKYRYYIAFRTQRDQFLKELFVSTKKLPAGEKILVLYLEENPKIFLVVESLPVVAQRFFKHQAGYSGFTLHI